MGKIYGKDGSIYNDPMEAVRANARWDQQERQNQLIKEQNEILKKQLKNENNFSSSTSSYDYDSEKFDLFVDFLVPLFLFGCAFAIVKFGLIDAFISGILYMFGININYQSGQSGIGMMILSFMIVIYIYNRIRK